MKPYPFLFHPIYKTKVWGGQSLRNLGRILPASPPGQGIGESWELADLDATSPTGGGGEAAHSQVANGPLAGLSIRKLIAELGAALTGSLPLTPDGAFPLLVKLLDARENLSLQVHPSPAYAADHPDAYLKHEAWYILRAAPGAAIYKGLRPGVDPARFAQALRASQVESLLHLLPVRPGELHYLPSGTPHALGAGIVVVEIQTPSDTTYRLFDWNRTGRPMQIEQALACMRYDPVDTAVFEPGTTLASPRATVRALCHCDHFRIEHIAIPAAEPMPIAPRRAPMVWIILEGAGRIACRHDSASRVPYRSVSTILMPADLTEPRIEPDSPTAWLQVTFPQASDLIA